MKKHLLTTAVAVALGTVASTALAFNPSDPATPAAYEVVFAGATASSNTVRTWIMRNVCASGVDVFRRVTSETGGPGGTRVYGNDWAVACVTKAAVDINGDGDTADAGETLAGGAKRVVFRKKDSGGSGFGVTPITHPMVPVVGGATFPGAENPAGSPATGFKVSILVPSAAPAASPNCALPTALATPIVHTEWSCGAVTELEVPDAGFSDIEPSKFVDINTPAGLPEWKSSSGVPSFPFGALTFGIPVTLDLSKALQAAQHQPSSTNHCNPRHPDYILDSDAVTPGIQPWGETEGCMANLTETEIRSLFTGGIKKWDTFLVKNVGWVAGDALVPLASHIDVVALNVATPGFIPANKAVQVCRRVPGSGTQAQFNAIFLNWPCDTAVTKPLTQPGFGGVIGPVVAENSGSNDVSNCLDDFNDITNASLKNPIPPATGSVKRWAIGINSTENNVPKLETVAPFEKYVFPYSYRFVKIDGVAPTIHNVNKGDYEDYAEQSFQYRTDKTTLLNASGTDEDDTLSILAYVAAQGNTPDDTATINLSYPHLFGQGGWLVVPKTPDVSVGALFTPGNPFSLAKPVNSSTRAPFGAAPNTCHFPTVIKSVEGG